MHMQARTHTHTHTRLHAYMYAHTYMHACTGTHVCTHTQVHTYTHTHMRVCAHTHIHACTHTHIRLDYSKQLVCKRRYKMCTYHSVRVDGQENTRSLAVPSCQTSLFLICLAQEALRIPFVKL